MVSYRYAILNTLNKGDNKDNNNNNNNNNNNSYNAVRDGVFGIATPYGLEGPGIKFRCGRDFPHPPKYAVGPTQPPLEWLRNLSRG